MRYFFVVLTVVAALSGCSVKRAGQSAHVSLAGTVEELGMTTFQYGTHLLKTGDKSYALKSDKVDINKYVGKPVKLEGKVVDGYPVENGPQLIDVSKMTER
ncbi:hypothetical protein [Pedobacter faecalis]|uniref:hypothetical protein n=1 Tax=Pedobacter faecalis TaxID=3041495 RepID=UPI00254E9A7E|nr:hypothetical protein [Pedobacter sp. ELA7]